MATSATARDKLRVLVLEDRDADAELLKREVRRVWPAAEFARADSQDSFLASLLTFRPDVILSDHGLPQYTGSDALALARRLTPDTPFIMVTGSLDEETAVECIKAGATDYVLKENLIRLIPAIEAALELARSRHERAVAMAELEDAAERYRMLFARHPHPMFVLDAQTYRILDANEAASLRYGYRHEELRHMRLDDLLGSGEAKLWRDTLIRRAPGALINGSWRHRAKDGRPIDVEVSGEDIMLSGRVAILLLAVDITERRRVERHRQQAQKMEAVGRLAGGVAHDFNNILTAIIGFTDLLMAGGRQVDPTDPDLREVRAAATRGADLTRQLLAFGRRQAMAPQLLDLNELIRGLDGMLRRLVGNDREFQATLAADLGTVRADPGQLEQVLVNLVINARDATPRGGRLAVATANADLFEMVADLLPGRYVRISVTDTGLGMSEATLARVFEPFFTTKEQGQGSGLGLATVYGIVKQSGGGVVATSALGRGSEFSVYLPRLDLQAEPIRTAHREPGARGGSETILVVEDDTAVRRLVQRTLQNAGYQALEAASGEDAVRLAAGHQAQIHLVVSDLVMPGMSGSELLSRLRQTRPGCRMLYLSAYGNERTKPEADVTVLSKPFTPEELVRAVRHTLDAR